MAARIDVFFLLGLWLLTPWVTRKLDRDGKLPSTTASKRFWERASPHHDLWDTDLPWQPTLVDIRSQESFLRSFSPPKRETSSCWIEQALPSCPHPNAPFREVRRPAITCRQPSPSRSYISAGSQADWCRHVARNDPRPEGLPNQLSSTALRRHVHAAVRAGDIGVPGQPRVFEWDGIAVDPVRQIVIANPINIPFVSQLVPRGQDNPAAPNDAHSSDSEIGVQPMYGTPYGVSLHPMLSPVGLPCLRPPWGYMAGIDLKTRKIAWMHRNGTIRDSSPVPIPIKMGVPMLGGPMTSAGGVAFLTSTMDSCIRAYDVRRGEQLWQDRLPAGGQSTPMTYAVGGRQYVVTAAGGHGSFDTKVGDYVIAYTLSKEGRIGEVSAAPGSAGVAVHALSRRRISTRLQVASGQSY